MSPSSDITERRARILGDLAERGHVLACRLHDDAMAAEPGDRAALAAAFHQVARTVRQTLALEARLERELQRAAREVREEATVRRRAQVHATVRRLVWTEAEPSDAQRLEDTLEDLLDEDALDPAFAEQAVDAVIERLKHDLGLHIAPDAAEPRRFDRKRRDRNQAADYLGPSPFPFRVYYDEDPPGPDPEPPSPG